MTFERTPGLRALKRTLLNSVGAFAIYGRRPTVDAEVVNTDIADTELANTETPVSGRDYLRVGGRPRAGRGV